MLTFAHSTEISFTIGNNGGLSHEPHSLTNSLVIQFSDQEVENSPVGCKGVVVDFAPHMRNSFRGVIVLVKNSI